jgi:S1-C subfamily serine protease
MESLTRVMEKLKAGETAQVQVARDGKILPLTLTVMERQNPPVRPDESRPTHTFLGFGLTVEDGGPGRVRIKSVEPGSPAARAGLIEGDWILSIDGRPVRSIPGMKALVSKRKSFIAATRTERPSAVKNPFKIQAVGI